MSEEPKTISNEPKVITLANLAEATEQEVFDQAALHLLRQGEKSGREDIGGQYRYLSPEGRLLKCAAGCFIAEDEYDPGFEGSLWRSLVKDKKVPAAHLELIAALQDLHDLTQVVNWATNLACLTDQYDLVISPCTVSMLKLQGAFHEPKI